MRGLRVLLALNGLALLAVAAWFRLRLLGNMPGVNGDEAWYGVQALEWLRGGHYLLRTPSALPVNPLFFGPLVLVHTLAEPSFGLLRSVAVGAGLATLLINYLLARWVWDRPTAVLSTLVLAVLPVNIVYSRLAWDACLSVAATLAVLYVSIAAVQRPARAGALVTAGAALLCLAALVHPTNLVAGALWLPAAWIVRGPGIRQWRSSLTATRGRRLAVLAAALGALVLIVAVGGMLWQNPRVRKAASSRIERVLHWTNPQYAARSLELAAIRYARLLDGGTVYRFTAGSTSVWEWPASDEEEGWGADVFVVWGLLGAAAWFVWSSARRARRPEDMVLLVGWALQLAGFLAMAGVDGLRPHYERYALSLSAPPVALLARGAMLALAARPAMLYGAAVAASVFGWLVLGDFQRSFFAFIAQTGGRSHMAFVTGPEDPKQAAVEFLRADAQAHGPCLAVASEWWSYWPMRYLALPHPGVRVIQAGGETSDFPAMLAKGRVWFVELSPQESPPRALPQFKTLQHQVFRDYAGRPAVHAVRVEQVPSLSSLVRKAPHIILSASSP